MVRLGIAAWAAGAAALLSSSPCAAASADSIGTLYALITPPSALEVGCQGPCACPLITFPTYGSFRLVPISVGPLFNDYAVESYIASFNNGPGAIAITGSGHYQIGGEVAVMQQLTLDLDIEGQPTEHFDSGLVPVSARFPAIQISCAVHGFSCDDSVLIVDALPAATAGTSAPRSSLALEGASPNPFRQGTLIALTLPRAQRVSLTIVDLAGRRVRALLSSAYLEAGWQHLRWDGRRDDGRMASAGVYWIVLRGPDGADRRTIVKLD
jgi:hypothetical protein